jgi:hypothetical protein
MDNHLPAFLMLLGLLAGGTTLAGAYWIRDYRERVRQRALSLSANDPAPGETGGYEAGFQSPEEAVDTLPVEPLENPPEAERAWPEETTTPAPEHQRAV